MLIEDLRCSISRLYIINRLKGRKEDVQDLSVDFRFLFLFCFLLLDDL